MPGVVAPAVVALFSVALWLPWLLVATSAVLAILALRLVAGHLPAHALRPGPPPAPAARVPHDVRPGATG